VDLIDQAGTWIETFVTDMSLNFITYLDRSIDPFAGQSFRHFTFRREIGGPGMGSLEYRAVMEDGRPNPVLAAHPNLFDPSDSDTSPNLVWMTYRGRTTVWIIETLHQTLDSRESAGLWFTVSGKGVQQLLADRLVWPTGFTLATPAGGSPYFQTYGSPAGQVITDCIQNSNDYLMADGVTPLFRTPFSEGFFQVAEFSNYYSNSYRFNNLLTDVVRKFEEANEGWLVVEGSPAPFQSLTYNWFIPPDQLVGMPASGQLDLSGSVVFQEGADIVKLERVIDWSDALSALIGEGSGAAQTVVTDDNPVARQRQGYFRDSSAADAATLQAEAYGTLATLGGSNAVGFEFRETVYRAFIDFDMGDTVGAVSTSLGSNDAARIVAMTFAEDDVNELVRVAVDLAAPLADPQAQHKEATLGNASSIEIMHKQAVGDQVWSSVVGYQNGWTYYGAPYVTARYRKDGQGFVHLAGTIKSGTMAAAAFTLPVGYRPSGQLIFPAASGSTTRIDVKADGTVVPTTGTATSCALDAITFYADQ
jgi:hypothetical protein